MNTELPAEPAAQKEVNLRQAITQGGLWIFFARWSVRGIGILSTIVLARLLAPGDFGLVAICALLIGLAETIGREAQNLAVIRKQNLDRAFMDSAWTASIIINLFLGAAVFSSAPLVASYFNEPRALTLVHVMSIRVLMIGFENIGMALYRKDFNFSMSYNYIILEKVIPAVITITLALYLRNYWALVIGSVMGYAGMIIASYLLHDYRPRICFKKIYEVWAFSGWVVLEKLAIFGTMRADYFFIPAFGKTTEVGHYHVGAELARMPTVELFSVLDRALFPAYARLLDQPRALAYAFTKILSAAAIVCLPVSIGFALVAGDAVRLIYGQQWIPMIPVVVLISMASGIAAINSMATLALQAIGKSLLSAGIVCLQLTLLLGSLFFFRDQFSSMTDIAWVRLLTTLAVLPVALTAAQIVLSISFMETLKAFWRPVLAVAAMACVLLYVLPPSMDIPVALRLALRCAAGGLVYAGVLLLLWLIARKPPGLEQEVVAAAQTWLKSRSGPSAG
ncbi:MAG: oligosaccharide flippase family protein [Alphaproteobacteria bacterium]